MPDRIAEGVRGKNKNPTDRCSGQWGWVVLGLKKGLGLRYLTSHPSEVTVIVAHIALIALQSLEYGIHSVFLDRLSVSSGKELQT
jgi:hypothetical protein